MLRRRFGSFERVAPSHGPLPLEAHHVFHRFAAEHDLGEPVVDSWVMAIREGYLAPMGLLARSKTGRGYEVPKNVDRNELVQMVLRVAEHHPATSVVYADLADSVYGLVPDQIHLLLAFLVLLGEIDVVKGARSIRDSHEALATADKYDRIALGRLRGRLDPGRPLIVLADHGVRLDSGGRAWRHGGSSTLERAVPVLHFEPR